MSNVAKLKKKAAEFEQKKQFDKALAIYIQILDEHDDESGEADVALYNRVGDLLMRQGTVGDAVTYYEKAVDLYAEGGFFNNAIALCNKILRQSPGRNSIYYKLGKISAKKGFNTDAKQNFLEYADRMQKAGQIDEAFRALKEFADLCPDQDDIRLMLAEQLAKKNRKGEAMEQLQSLYDKFESEGRGAEARATVDRMKAIDPDVEPKASAVKRPQKSSDLVFLDVSWDEPPAKKPAARSTVQLRAPAEPPAPPPPVDDAHAAPDSHEETAEEIAEEIAEETGDTERGPYIDDVSLPMIDTSRTVAERAAADDTEADQAEVVAGLVRGVDFEPGGGTYGSSRDDGGLIAGLEPTAIEEDGVDADSGIVNLDPPLTGDQFANLRLGTPAGTAAVHPHEHDLALPGELPMLDTAPGDEDGATGGELQLIMPDDTDLLDIPEGIGASLSDLEPPIARREFDPSRPVAQPFEVEHSTAGFTMPDLSDISDGDLPMLEIEPQEATASESIEMDLLGATGALAEPEDAMGIEPSTLDFMASTSPPEAPRAPLLSDSELDEAMAPPPRRSSRPRNEPVEPAVLDGMVRLSEENAPPPAILRAKAAADEAAGVPPSKRRSSTSILAQSVDGLRLRVATNESDWTLRRQLGEALLEGGEREAGLQELEAALIGFERQEDLETARSVAEEIIRVNPNSVRHHQKRVEYAFRTSDKSRLIDAYRELADALFRGGQADKSRAVYQRVLDLAPDDPRATAALAALVEPTPAPAPRREKEREKSGTTGTYRRYTADVSRAALPEPEPVPSGADDAFVNLGDWLRSDEVPKSTRMVVGEQEPSGDEQADFADMLKKFKQGVSENVEEEDHESHYDLGVAYKEMGLVDEAIAEFQKSLRGVERRVRTYEALGQCFLEKKQFQVASTILQRALAERGHGDEQLVGVLYLLGYCSEALQKWSDAILYYQRVFSVDIQFRDVAERLTSLERVAR